MSRAPWRDWRWRRWAMSTFPSQVLGYQLWQVPPIAGGDDPDDTTPRGPRRIDWMSLHTDLLDDPTFWRLGQLLHMDEGAAFGYVQRLRLWSLNSAPDGNLGGLTDAEIAYSARFMGDADLLVQAMTDCGFLSGQGADRRLVPWADSKVDKLLKDRANATQRQRKHRAGGDA